MMGLQVTPSGLYQDSVEAPEDGEEYLRVRIPSCCQGHRIAGTLTFRTILVYMTRCKSTAFKINFVAWLSGCHFTHEVALHEHSFGSLYPGIISTKIMCSSSYSESAGITQVLL